MYYIYVIKSKKDKRLYIGYTRDLQKRLILHNSKKTFSTKYRTPFELIYYEAYKSPRDAHKREAMLKLFGNAWTQLKKRLKNSL